MTTSLVQEFSRKYESLAGKVHIVGGVAQAIEAVDSILREVGAKCVALAELPGAVQAGVESYCATNGVEFVKPPYPASTMPGAVDRAQAGISVANFAIAETGALVEITHNDASRLVSTLPRAHIALLWAEDLIATLGAAAPLIRGAFEQNKSNCVVSFISGPSRSGDIEMKLTLGVHGPEKSYVVVLTDSRALANG